MQNVWDVTETVTEESMVEEIPPNTWEHVPQCLSTERREMTGELSNCTVKVHQREVTKKPPPDHESDQEESEDKESSSEVNQRADGMKFIKYFQDAMNHAIEQLLNKSVRRHSCRKDKPEPCTEQGKHKESIWKEAEMLPPRNVSGESDNERNSIASLETMDTDKCIQRLVRTEPEGSEHAQWKIEKTAQYWAAKEKEAVMNNCRVLELNNSVSNKRVQQLYSHDQSQEMIDQAERPANSARQTLDNIQRVDEARFSRNSPKYPRTPRATERHKYARDNMQVMYGESHERITQPVQANVPNTERYQSPEAETATVYPIRDHDYHDRIMRMVCSTLEENQEDNPNESVIAQTRLNIISPPEEHSGSSDLEVYKTFIARIL